MTVGTAIVLSVVAVLAYAAYLRWVHGRPKLTGVQIQIEGP